MGGVLRLELRYSGPQPVVLPLDYTPHFGGSGET